MGCSWQYNNENAPLLKVLKQLLTIEILYDYEQLSQYIFSHISYIIYLILL